MTREEALHKKLNPEGSLVVASVIDSMIADFESRTCEGCKYISSCGKQCNNGLINDMVDPHSKIVHSLLVTKDFGCNKWEAK